MKKYIIILLIIISGSILKAQKNEYRYVALKAGISHNYNFFASRNNSDVMFTTLSGDMLKSPVASINYIPGGAASLNYHIDSKTDKRGFVVGIEFQNNGFRSKYVSENGGYFLVDQYRVQAIGIPFSFKLSGSNIYINQKYFYAGVQYNYYIVSQNIQKASWDGQIYSHALSIDERRKSGLAAFLGFNYYIYNFQIEYWTSNFVNPEYITQNNGAVLKPYSHLPKANFFLKTSINIPLTRWLTTKSWTAEKIRRIFNGR